MVFTSVKNLHDLNKQYMLLPQDESEQRPRDIVTSFLTEIVLALKEVSGFIFWKFRSRKYR